jgi:hypothetical protein
MSDPNMARWRVWIDGPKGDIQCLKDHPGDTDWCIEFDDSMERHYIRADRFEELDTASEVHASASQLVDQISLAGLSRWAGFGNISVGSVYEMGRDGPIGQSIMLGTATYYQEDADHEAGSVQERIDLLIEQPSIAAALRYIRDERNWLGYYRAYEAIGKRGDIVTRGIVTEKECRRFTKSARSRHYKVPSPSENQMTEEGGRVWITNVVRRLVASLMDEQ